jgi:large subunit ribosomal protein L25
MEQVIIKANKRETIGKHVKALRREGLLPGVIYGPHIDPVVVNFDYHEANRLLASVTSSQLIIVDVDGVQHATLIREKQRHPLLGTLQHVDFMAVSMTETLRADVRIETKGESPAVSDLGGVLVFGQEQIEVECLPGNLVDRVVVDISNLKEIGDAIYVKELNLPDTITILTDPSEMLVLVTMPAIEEVEEVIEEEEEEEPEVIEHGKQEEEGEEED